MAGEKKDICSIRSVLEIERITSVAGENEANVAGPYSGACPACVNGSGTAHVRAYGTDENVVVVKGREERLGRGRVWVKERWGRAGHRIRRQGSSGLKNTPITPE